jgi:tRNA threonylcarbamoyladenosine biosynthesis protein TsaE
MIVIRVNSAEETVNTGKRLGGILKRGDVVCLTGDLGAGKTAFTKGIGRALEISDHITSPTFTLVNEYNGRVPLYHFDVYRLKGPEDVYGIGFEEYIYGNGISVIEWADLVNEVLPAEHIWVTIEKDNSAGQDARIITIVFKGRKYKEREELFSV